MAKIIIETDDKTHFLFKNYCAKKNVTMKKIISDYIRRCIMRRYRKGAKYG